MTFVKWSPVYSVGVQEIDRQHAELIKLVNDFYEQLDAGDASAPKKLLVQLMDYALSHFRTEEGYFKRFHYSDTEMHIKQHRLFEDKVNEYVKAYQETQTFNPVRVREFLKDWILQHILIHDKKYMRCFKENGLT